MSRLIINRIGNNQNVLHVLNKFLFHRIFFSACYFFSLFLMLCGCKNDIAYSDNIERIDLQNIGANIEKADLEIFKTIPLEYNDVSIIGAVRKLDFYNDKLIIQNQRSGGQLVFFDLDGSFLGLIDKLGKGPGEYLELRDFAINREKEEILILDKNDRVHFYDFDYDFIRTIRIPKEFDHRRISSRGEYIYTSIFSIDGRNLCISSYNGKLIESYFPSPRETFSIGRPFETTSENLWMKVKACDTIYKLAEDRFTPSVLLDFGDKALPHSIAMKTTTRQGVPKNIKYMMNSNFFETSDNYLFNISTHNFKIDNYYKFFGYYDKNTQQTLIFKKNEFGNDIMPDGINIWNTFQGNYFCSVLYPPLLHDYYSTIKKTNNVLNGDYDLLHKLCETCSVDSNPLILIFQINNNF